MHMSTSEMPRFSQDLIDVAQSPQSIAQELVAGP